MFVNRANHNHEPVTLVAKIGIKISVLLKQAPNKLGKYPYNKKQRSHYKC